MVDIEWAREQLVKYLALEKACGDAVPAGDDWNERASGFNDQATELLPTVTRILQAIGAPPAEPLLPPSHASAATGRLVRQGLGILRDREEWAVRLAPDEPEAPMLTADGLHPWIWRAASPFWETGQRATAVEYGAKSLTAHIQQKSGSKLADRELAADVFSPKPHKTAVPTLASGRYGWRHLALSTRWAPPPCNGGVRGHPECGGPLVGAPVVRPGSRRVLGCALDSCALDRRVESDTAPGGIANTQRCDAWR